MSATPARHPGRKVLELLAELRRRGTGLGLSMASQIVVNRHDGVLTFDSSPDPTTFHVSLPLTEP